MTRSAAEITAAIRAGRSTPEEVVRLALAHIYQRDDQVGAFQLVDEAGALSAARALTDTTLPLAGVPIAIKDNLDVAGWPTRNGTRATPEQPATQDHEVVKRLRAAGAIMVGKTRVSELCIWATTDSCYGVTRNPWDPARTPGGSSGGSAAAVAMGAVPVAIGNDALGSIRVPAACCGLFGIKPGYGTVPAQIGGNDWFGLAENGPLATTVRDAAVALAVMAGKPQLAEIELPARKLRIALSTAPPMSGITLDREFKAGTERIAELLRAAGHQVEAARPPLGNRRALVLIRHWFAGGSVDADALDPARLEPRTRAHARAGRLMRRLGWVGAPYRQAWRETIEPFFARYDLLLTPGLARPPLRALAWRKRSWSANLIANARYAPFCAAWNLAGYPAAAVPAGLHSCGTPLSVQLVAGPGREALLLSVGLLIESRQPWPRYPETALSTPEATQLTASR